MLVAASSRLAARHYNQAHHRLGAESARRALEGILGGAPGEGPGGDRGGGQGGREWRGLEVLLEVIMVEGVLMAARGRVDLRPR